MFSASGSCSVSTIISLSSFGAAQAVLPKRFITQFFAEHHAFANQKHEAPVVASQDELVDSSSQQYDWLHEEIGFAVDLACVIT